METQLTYKYDGLDFHQVKRGANKGIYIDKLYFFDSDGDRCHVWASIELKYGETLRAYQKYADSLFRQEDELGELLVDL